MKLTAILLFATMLTTYAFGNAQPITLSQKNVSLQTVFEEIKRQTGFTFVYTAAVIQKAKKVTIHVRNASLEAVLTQCFKEQPLSYTIVNAMVVIKEKEASTPGIASSISLRKPLQFLTSDFLYHHYSRDHLILCYSYLW